MRRLLLAIALVAAIAAPTQAARVLDGIAAVVNDDVVLASELEAELAAVRSQIAARDIPMPPADELRRQVLERLIVQTLQLDMAERAGITVDDATLDAAIRRVAERNRLTLTQFRDALRAEGLTVEAYREQLRREIVIARLQRSELQRRVNITPQEIDQFLAQSQDQRNEYRLQHILIAIPEAASPQAIAEAREQAERIRSEVLAGANFATMAATWSDSGTALQGGDLGWRSAGELPTILAQRVEQLDTGELTPILRSPSGFHIFRLAERREGDRRVVTQTHARHILIRTNAVVSDEDARRRLQSLRRRIDNGASFAELARANSDDDVSASQGGDLGWITPGTMVERFETVVDRLQPGELSRPFQTRFGWHLVQVLDRRRQDTTEDYRREQAAQALSARKEEEELQLWLRQLREEAYVDIRIGVDAS